MKKIVLVVLLTLALGALASAEEINAVSVELAPPTIEILF